MPRKYNAFLSYNRQDKPIVEAIARWLEVEANLSVWLDKWNLIPGDPWQEGIEEALDESECCIVFLGPNGIGPWQKEEMRSALDEKVSKKSIRVVPVLLPGALRPKEESKLPRFLRRLVWVTFQENWQEKDNMHRLVCGIKGIPPGRGEEKIQPDVCPFRGLEVFREQDQRFFFGREAVVQRLLDKLNSSRFLAVLGSSGCGKSSIVQAGLIPHLRQHSEVALFTPHEEPFVELAFELLDCCPKSRIPPVEQLIDRLKDSEENLNHFAREVLKNKKKKNLVIVIDQFEELFTQTGSEEDRRQFIFTLLHAVEKVNGLVKVILTMRSDFMGRCAFYPDLNTYVSEHLFQVEPMSPDELRRAIEEPVRMVGIHFETGLVDRILNDVKGAPSELPLLEHALLELYKQRMGVQLTSMAYRKIGKIEGALVNRADSEFEKLDDVQKEILRRMFMFRFIQLGEETGNTNRRATKEELLAVSEDSRVAKNLLDQLAEARLLTITRDHSRNQVLVEVAHEALIRKWEEIGNWIKKEEETIRRFGTLRHAVQEWKRMDCNPDYLFEKSMFAPIEALYNTHFNYFTKIEMEYVNACFELRKNKDRKKEERQQKEQEFVRELASSKAKIVKRTRIIVWIVIVSSIFLLYLAYELNLVENGKKICEAKSYWKKSRDARKEGKLILALHLFAKAASINPDDEFQKILLVDMYDCWKCYERQYKKNNSSEPLKEEGVITNGSIKRAIFIADGTKVLIWYTNGTIRLRKISVDPKKEKEPDIIIKGVNNMIYVSKKKMIITHSEDQIIRFWNAIKKEKKQTGELGKIERIRGMKYDEKRGKIITWSEDGKIRVWDVIKGEQIGETFYTGGFSGMT